MFQIVTICLLILLLMASGYKILSQKVIISDISKELQQKEILVWEKSTDLTQAKGMVDFYKNQLEDSRRWAQDAQSELLTAQATIEGLEDEIAGANGNLEMVIDHYEKKGSS